MAPTTHRRTCDHRSNLVERLAGRKVFSVGRRSFTGEDLAIALHLWGVMSALEKRAREGLACAKRVGAEGEWLRDAELEDEAADAWRYDRNLLSADETQAWLADRKLDMDEWLAYVERSALRAQWPDELAGIVRAHRVVAGEVAEVLYCEAVCSGALEEGAERLAARAAVYERTEAESKTAVRCSKADVRSAMKGLPADVRRNGLLGLRGAATVERAERIACLDIVFARFVDRIAAPAALKREVDAHTLEWTRIDGKSVEFDSEEAAREAALLVRTDGQPFERAAKTAKAAVSSVRLVMEDLDGPLRDRLTAALPGELVGPVEVAGRHVLVSVEDRVAPKATAAYVKERARQRVIRRTIQREIEGRVRWDERV